MSRQNLRARPRCGVSALAQLTQRETRLGRGLQRNLPLRAMDGLKRPSLYLAKTRSWCHDTLQSGARAGRGGCRGASFSGRRPLSDITR